jgi:choline dehydrogenase
MADEEYDFIVVGSGAGGGPLAARLASAPRGYRVALLEAGIDPGAMPGSPTYFNVAVPALYANASEDPNISWEFFVQHFSEETRQRSSYDRKYSDEDHGVFYPRAAALGGCTAHHAMISVYPFDSDWANIQKLTENDTWSPESMRKIFKEIEDCQYLEALEPANQFSHGKGGWLPISMSDPSLAIRDPLLLGVLKSALETHLPLALADSLHDVGRFLKLIQKSKSLLYSRGLRQLIPRIFATFDPNLDVGDAYRTGVFNTPTSILHGVRTGVRERILAVQARYPQRLNVITGALVTKVLLNKNPLQAIGVEYLEGKGLYKATPKQIPATKNPVSRTLRLRPGGEVILSGGAFNTPQLLMLSGIGDADHLQSKNIEPLCNLPGVGLNLQDRYEMTLVTEFTDPSDEFSLLDGLTFKTPQGGAVASARGMFDMGFQQWFNHRGVYATNGVVLSFILRSKQAKDGVPDLFVFGVPGNFQGYKRHWSEQVQTDGDGKNENHRRFTWTVLKARTQTNAGYVRLLNKDPLVRPEINFMSFDDAQPAPWEQERDAVAEGIQFALKIMKMTEKPFKVIYPLEEEALRNPKMLAEKVVAESWGHHACGTCKIGSKADPTAVLDGDFRVRGVQSLRVVDASVFPKIPGFFIVTPIYMISEKAAKVILAEADSKPTDEPPHR